MAEDKKVETTAEKLRRANIANIIKRLNAGKTLNAVEQAALKEYEDAEKPASPTTTLPISPKKWALYWRVSRVTIHNWTEKARETPPKMPRLDDVPAMLEWEKTQDRAAPAFKERCKELRMERGETAPAPKVDEAWLKYRATAGESGPADHKAQIKTLEVFRDGYAMKLDEAMARSAHDEVARWNSLLIETTNSIRQNKLAAEKLGLDRGDIISFEEMDRIIAAFGFWTMRQIELHLDAISGKLAALSPGFEKKLVRAVLEPELLSERFLVAFAKASKPSGVSLPARAVAKLKQTVGDYLEDGERLFREAP